MFENIQNSFNGMFGKIASGMCRLTMNGSIAVKCSNGYKSYNVKKGTLTNVTNFCFNVGDEMFFVIPTNKVEVGDIILVGGKPKCVTEANKVRYGYIVNETMYPFFQPVPSITRSNEAKDFFCTKLWQGRNKASEAKETVSKRIIKNEPQQLKLF